MMKRILIAVICVVLAESVAAQQVGIWVQGSGTISCSEWTKERIAKNQAAEMHGSWVLGFVVGVRMAHAKNWGGQTDNDGLFAWIDDYCRANPLNKLLSASSALIDELKKLTPSN